MIHSAIHSLFLNPLLAHLVYLFVIAISLNIVAWIIYRLSIRRFKHVFHFAWGRAILISAFKPTVILIWYLTLVYGAQWTIASWQNDRWSHILDEFARLGILLFVMWFLFRLIKYVEIKMKEKKFDGHAHDKTTIEGISKVLRVLLFIITLLIILQNFGVPLAAVYTAAGGAGLGITLAAQDLLKNFFGGLVLYFDRPFVIGDWVRSPDKEIEGNVEYIGWRATCIRTFDMRPLYVPNSTFLTVSVENPSRMTHRLLKYDIGVGYDDIKKIPVITAAIGTMLKTHPNVDNTQTLWVHLTQFNASSVNIRMYAYTQNTHWSVFQKTQEDILLQVSRIIAEQGATMPYPIQTIQLSGDTHVDTPKN